MFGKYAGMAGLAAVALLAAGCSSSSPASPAAAAAGSSPASTPASSAGSSAPASGSGAVLMTTSIGGTAVVTNAAGYTLYWFAPDTSTTSKCTGTCATYWPPVKGPVTAGSGVTGTLGMITRSDGTTQATYDGHPLYTYVADTAPGEAKGNDINASGGLWYEVTVSGSAAPAASPTAKSGGGY